MYNEISLCQVLLSLLLSFFWKDFYRGGTVKRDFICWYNFESITKKLANTV